jgi:hypothetical protein
MLKNANPVTVRRSPRLNKTAASETLSYKSIIQTRSQKIAEKANYLQAMFQDIDSFYTLNKREPLLTDDKPREIEMAHFIKSLRDAHAKDCLGGQSGVDTVKKALPWFKFVQPRSCGSTLLSAFIMSAYLATVLSAAYLMEICFVKKNCPEFVGDVLSVVTTAQIQMSAAFTDLASRLFKTS